MTTTPMEDTGLDVTVLEALDFDIPCEIREAGQRCDNIAAWIVRFRPHCPKARVQSFFLVCQSHVDRLTNGEAKANCPACRVEVVLKDYVISIEPLTKGHHE